MQIHIVSLFKSITGKISIRTVYHIFTLVVIDAVKVNMISISVVAAVHLNLSLKIELIIFSLTSACLTNSRSSSENLMP